MPNIAPAAGSVSVDNPQVYTRDEAGEQLSPPVSGRTVTRYLEMLVIFAEENFGTFKNPFTGGLNGERLTDWHLFELQRVRSLFVLHRNKLRVQMELKMHYQHQQYN
jgi:hypothetical protein